VLPRQWWRLLLHRWETAGAKKEKKQQEVIWSLDYEELPVPLRVLAAVAACSYRVPCGFFPAEDPASATPQELVGGGY
jgi:hypothetical protein